MILRKTRILSLDLLDRSTSSPGLCRGRNRLFSVVFVFVLPYVERAGWGGSFGCTSPLYHTQVSATYNVRYVPDQSHLEVAVSQCGVGYLANCLGMQG